MPITKSGAKVMRSMKKEYGDQKGEEVFYAMINSKAKGSEKWHGAKKAKRSLSGMGR